ncbi:T9SS type A sorting domain-containing protein [Flavisolibacter tropicus]|uniref:T9SS type A sorting domain-containing protein n=1 Tax=Flavisolibacter tropicus TaxID=1492898 RepID=UPI0009020284|nr:T9SS type A sorting domain-containing protein [Flavisolibacter tropicus]
MRRLLLLATLIISLSVFSDAQSPRSTSPETAGPVLRFYPNPATTVINFDFQANYEKGCALAIYNFMGQEVYSAKNIASKTTVNLNTDNFKRGLHFYRLYDASGKLLETNRFQVSK